jgi:hypothetical protein
MNLELQELVGAFFRQGMREVRVYGLWKDARGDNWLYYVPLHGQSPATSEYVRARCRRYLCSPHDAPEWIRDEKFPKNPSLVVMSDISDISNRLFFWPHLPHRRIRSTDQTESHALDLAAFGIAEDSQVS